MSKAKHSHSTQRRRPSVSNKSARKVDSELLELGRQHDILVQEYVAACVRWAPVWAKQKEICDAWMAQNPHASQKAYLDKHGAVEEEMGKNAGMHPDALTNRLDPVANAILRIPALTISGLAVKAKLAAFANRPAGGAINDSDLDWEDLTTHRLIEAVLGMAAVEPVRA